MFWVDPVVTDTAGMPEAQSQAQQFDLLNFLPMVFREVDETDGSFQNFAWVFNQMWAQLTYDAATTTERITNPEITPLIRELCNSRGNPFQFLSDSELRRVADSLFSIYKRRGSEPGTIHAVWYLLGVSISIEWDYNYSWRLGQDRLNVSTILSSRSSRVFRVSILQAVSPELYEHVHAVIQFMRPAYMQFHLIETFTYLGATVSCQSSLSATLS
jgi:hypothetical protein